MHEEEVTVGDTEATYSSALREKLNKNICTVKTITSADTHIYIIHSHIQHIYIINRVSVEGRFRLWAPDTSNWFVQADK